jgi:hypothetical protein
MPFSPFGSTVEVAGVTPFLDRQPIDMLLDASVQDLPWITSVTTEEGLYPAAGIFLCQRLNTATSSPADDVHHYAIPKKLLYSIFNKLPVFMRQREKEKAVLYPVEVPPP